ncbi:MAG: hypothetical protein LBO21_03740 [Synergistaceae bacterium]|jgi:hypothetical protein|nr:hypothetical protein [Synergistaceae bacterium]
MPKQFNPNTVKTLYAPRFEMTAKDFNGNARHYSGVYFPTEVKARKAAEETMRDCEGQFTGYEIITISADLRSLFETYAKALKAETVVE